MMKAAAQVTGTRRRAPRYAIEVPVRFWPCEGEAGEGTTLNVSRLGMLFRTAASEVPPVSTPIQLRMALSANHGWAGAYVACSGRIVRVVPSAGGGETLVATTIDESALRPAGCEEAPPVGAQYAEGASLLHALADQDEDSEAPRERRQSPARAVEP